MRARYGPILALALALVPAWLCAADLKVEESPVPANSFAVVALDLEPGESCLWEVTPEPTKLKEVKTENGTAVHFSGPAGTKYTVRADVVNFEKKTFVRKRETVQMGQAPQPPPDPKVDPPKPVDPPQPQADAPIPGDGLRVMLVFDRLKLGAMSEEQKAVVYGRDVRDYLRAKSPKGPDGVTPEARFWPTDTDAGAESKLWQDAFARAKSKAGTEPLWLIVSNGKTGFEGKPPATVAEMLALLKKYGG